MHLSFNSAPSGGGLGETPEKAAIEEVDDLKAYALALEEAGEEHFSMQEVIRMAKEAD